jgi:NAD(P)-dependent dehydrogenase (short-subunit alcohol dehydrogenase family)
MHDLLKNKVAIVTGAGSGIGRAIAMQFAAAGARVVCSDIDEPGGAATVKAIAGGGGTALFVRSDTSRAADGEALVAKTVQSYGALHIAVNNAGIGGPSAPTGEYPIEGWDKVIAVNLSGVFYGMRFQLPAMVKAGGGAIVNITSILGAVGFRGAPAYVSAKHGLIGLTQNAALEYAAHNIRVNCVGPGFIRTPLVEKNIPPEALAGIAALHPLGRLGTSDEVAELVLWLSSDKASFVTGSYYPVDGGYLAQ